MELVDEGSMSLALAVLAVLVGGTLLELLWVRSGWLRYYRASVPLGAELVPLPSPPSMDEGRTVSLGFRRAAPGTYVWWADRDARSAPTLLHGLVQLVPAPRGGCAVSVTWAPPWTPVFAALWLIFLGIARGEAQVTVPIGSAMVLAMAVLYLRGARLAAAELRWALAQDVDEDDARRCEG